MAIEAGRNSGMRTLDDDIIRLVGKGMITIEVAWFCLQDKSRLNSKSFSPPPQGERSAGPTLRWIVVPTVLFVVAIANAA